MEPEDTSTPPAASAVLAKAAARAGAWLGLSEAELSAALQLGAPDETPQARSQSRHSALSLVQLAFELERIVGSADAARVWMRGGNTGLGRRPVDVLIKPGGAVELVDYLHRFKR